MRISELDILIVPGWTGSGPDHWQSRWLRRLKTARRIEQADWQRPRCADWVERIVAEATALTRPGVLVAHSCGVTAVAKAAPRLVNTGIAGAFLVAPADLDGHAIWTATDGGFTPLPLERFPFPARLIGSSTDPWCSVARALALGAAWGAQVSIVPNGGHINSEAGFGPWPEGLLTFGQFLARLGTASGEARRG